jgi:hypothetical protein
MRKPIRSVVSVCALAVLAAAPLAAQGGAPWRR